MPALVVRHQPGRPARDRQSACPRLLTLPSPSCWRSRQRRCSTRPWSARPFCSAASSEVPLRHEGCAATAPTHTCGRAPRGERLVCPVPHGHWRTTTFLCGFRVEGLVAPLVLDGTIDGPAFPAWIEQALAPALRPGGIAVIDDLGSHKALTGAKPSKRAGRRCSTCPRIVPTRTRSNSPSTSLQRLLRTAAIRSEDTPWNTIAAALWPLHPRRVRELHAPLRLCWIRRTRVWPWPGSLLDRVVVAQTQPGRR